MAKLRDSLLRAMLGEIENGRGMALVAAGSPWQCCPAASNGGPAQCTCWIPVYDLPQTDPSLDDVVALALGHAQPPVRHLMCGDCAYRPGSPERTGDDKVVGNAEMLEKNAADGTRFFCHDGMRRPIAWRHPAGIRLTAQSDADYQAPVVDGVPYRADGQPGLLCAGWAARNRALTGKHRAEPAMSAMEGS